jgi:beta-phosphoglucomutase-like phosphatase (HAD superfamily)
MCEKCAEIDGKIEHYHRLSSKITDQSTLDGIKELIEQMKAQKAALHPEQKQ